VLKTLKIVIISLFLLFPFYSVFSAESLSVVINEIAWMGTETNSSDEWVELYNNTNQDINLAEWGLYEAGGTTLIESLTGVIKEKSYYLIERTDDTTISDIPASQEPSSWGGYGLKNSGEHLQLLDNNSQVIDEVNCSESWFAGDNKTKKTMEKISPSLPGNGSSNWQTSQNAGGTPKDENSQIQQQLSEPEPEPETQPVKEQREEQKEEPMPIIYPSGILINELVPSPEGKDELEEWLELKNTDNQEVDISGWKIQDTIGSTKTYIFPEGTKIKANGYLVLARPVSKITLNNSGDGLQLIQPNGNILDNVTYGKALLGQSYNRTESGWNWSTILTPGEKNAIPEKEPSFIESSKDKKLKTESGSLSTESGFLKKETATIKEKIPRLFNSSFPLIIASLVAALSAIIILILKRGLKNNL